MNELERRFDYCTDRDTSTRIEMYVGDEKVGLLSFSTTETTMNIIQTAVFPRYRGKGYAAELVDEALRWCEEHNLKPTSTCWYAARVINKRSH